MRFVEPGEGWYGGIHVYKWSSYQVYMGKNKANLILRIMSVADVFVAITEDRPYRKGMDCL